MKKFSVSSLLTLLTLSSIFAFGSSKLSATTVTLELTGTGSQSGDGGYVYPYYFSVNGSSTSTSMMCISYEDEVWVGESWKATIEAISGTADEAAAWLLDDAENNPSHAVADQEAAWYLLDPVPGDSNGNNSQLAWAESMVTNNPNDASFYADYELYVPVAGSQPWGDGTPQTFLVDPQPPAVTPEPDSLVLLGTGLLAFAGVVYRKSRIGMRNKSTSTI